MANVKVFEFGKNWKQYLPYINDESIRQAETSLAEFIEPSAIKDSRFLDVGCGSGLFSLAAYRLGAKEIVSFDVDDNSVACCEHLKSTVGNPESWKVLHGSILDMDFLPGLGTFDIVYSWGVLHHTGDMWTAIKNSARLVKPGGFYYIALYNRTYGRSSSENWARWKRSYVNASRSGKLWREYKYMTWEVCKMLLRLRNPISQVRAYRSHRGMSWRRDVSDWLGGYPYEYASVEEMFRFMKSEFPDFVLENLKTTNYIGNNWFLFKRSERTSSLD